MATQTMSSPAHHRSRTSEVKRPTAARVTRAGERTPVRLTRRGRLAVLTLLVAVLFGAFSLGRAAPQAAPVGRTQPLPVQITVQPGESLWTVARRVAPDHDPREIVAQIRRLNDLTTWELRTGQQLLLPIAT